MSICTSIEKMNDVRDSYELLKVTIDNSVAAYWFYDYAESLKYLDQEVIVEYRDEIYHGELCKFIKTFVLPTVVQTLDKKENIKLYCDIEDNQSNLSFSEIVDGETRPGCIVYCVDCQFKSSSNAVWQELTIRDRSMHIAKLRLFNYDNKAANFKGSYVMTELSRNKFGFRSELISPISGEVAPNPELKIARQYIMSYFSNDPVSMQYITETSVLDYLSEDIDYERGYGLVRLATELSMVDAMYNMTKDVDLSAIGRALLCMRGYLTHVSVLSKSVNSIMVAMKYMWDNRKTVILLLDNPQDEYPLPERAIMESIRTTVNTMIDLRKGVVT